MDERTARFEEHRSQLRAVAYRMLGSAAEADDAVQEAWLRYARTDTAEVRNLRAWLTTVVARVCLTQLRTRSGRREQPLEDSVPELVVAPEPVADPEQEALLVEAVGLALQVVLDMLSPPERLAFVLHDMFAVPFEEIAPMLERSPEATRQLASRARRRVRGNAVAPEPDPRRQRAVVDAFFAAARAGDVQRLVGLLHPEVVLRSDAGPGRPGSVVVRGARAVGERAAMFADPAAVVRPAWVNGGAGVLISARGQLRSVLAFTVADGAVIGIDAVTDPARLAALNLPS